jgi:hypothetical protein
MPLIWIVSCHDEMIVYKLICYVALNFKHCQYRSRQSKSRASDSLMSSPQNILSANYPLRKASYPGPTYCFSRCCSAVLLFFFVFSSYRGDNLVVMAVVDRVGRGLSKINDIYLNRTKRTERKCERNRNESQRKSSNSQTYIPLNNLLAVLKEG